MQILADFVMECTISNEEPVKIDSPFKESLENHWVLHVDGSLNANGSGTGLILVSPEGGIFQYALRFGFFSSNNEIECEALITGLRISKELGV